MSSVGTDYNNDRAIDLVVTGWQAVRRFSKTLVKEIFCRDRVVEQRKFRWAYGGRCRS